MTNSTQTKLIEGLNSEQAHAVQSLSGSILVLAGAGSGKTKVLTQRIAYMIEQGVRPEEILAVTFTNKAAQEMKARLTTIIGEDKVKKLWVGTFHSICCRILRQDIEKYKTEDNRGWKSNFVIYSEDDSIGLVKQALKTLNIDEKAYPPKMIKSSISMAKNRLQDAFDFATNAKDYRSDKISSIFNLYEEQLITNNGFDFDDLLLMTGKLLEKCPEVLQKYHTRFKHIMVDEFQDTNLTQYNLIKSIYTCKKEDFKPENTRSLCVVGDVDQSIYSWRGADYRIILNFQKDFSPTQLICLEQNYRSTASILEVANKIIENNTERISKNLYSNKGKGQKVVVHNADDETEEAFYITSKIYDLTRNNNYNDFAVLYRTNAQSRTLEEAFMARAIPYRMVGGVKFYERKEIKDVIAYLRVIFNTDDAQGMKRIVNVPKRSIGATTVKKLDDISISNRIPVFEIIRDIQNYQDFNSKTQSSLLGFAKLILELREKLEDLVLSEFIAEVLDKSKYIDELREENTEESLGRIENLQEFISLAREFESSDAYFRADTNQEKLGEFLGQVALVSDLDMVEEGGQAVTLMTLHAAKGLEFPVVFLSGLEEGIFPHSRSLTNNSEMEEERRLMYVGVTRAETQLFITYAKRRLLWGDYKYNQRSRFLAEIPYNLLIFTGNTDNSDRNSDENRPSSFERKFSNYQKPQPDTYDSNVSFGKNFVAPTNQSITSSSNSGGFGKNFVAPQYNQNQESFVERTPKKIILQKKNPPQNTYQKPAKQAGFGSDVAKDALQKMKAEILTKLEAPTQKSDGGLKLTLRDVSIPESKKIIEPVAEVKVEEKTELFAEGQRVFHEKFGIGEIAQIVEMGSDCMYLVNFGSHGQKALDVKFSKLKKF